MRRRKIQKGKNKMAAILILLVVILLALGIPFIAMLRAGPSLEGLVQNAAMASVFYNMPQHTLDLLEERFRDQLLAEEPPSKEIPPPQKIPPLPPKPMIGESRSPDPKLTPNLDPIAQEIQPSKRQDIPAEYQGDILEENMSVSGGTAALPCYGQNGKIGNGFVKNTSKLTNEAVAQLLTGEDSVLEQISKTETKPQVLIMHTHATESFEEYDASVYDTRNSWRSTNNLCNVVAVGEELARGIRAHGIAVLHDDTQHDYPSYNGSYQRSAKTVNDYLKRYPSIKVVLDIHRDAVQRGATLVKPIAKINGKKTAQLMIISGCDDGSMNMPNWKKNLRFAAGLQNAMESKYPGLTRPVFFCYRRYNQELTSGSLLIEIGSHGNTLEEVLQAGTFAGEAIGGYLAGEIKN